MPETSPSYEELQAENARLTTMYNDLLAVRPTRGELQAQLAAAREQLSNSIPADPAAKLANLSWQNSAAHWWDQYCGISIRLGETEKALAAAREETAKYAEAAQGLRNVARFVRAEYSERGWDAVTRFLELAANPPNGESALRQLAVAKADLVDMTARMRTAAAIAEDALKRAAKLEAALQTIERSGHGLDGYESVEEERDYWTGVALRQRDQARAALAETAPEEPK